jgi:coenzyme F420-0:L-glutamate ligase/coenzyme F420-1:gamma-L-glutamate ligase
LHSKQEAEHLKSFTVSALENFPLVNSGDDIARLILEIARKNDLEIEDADVIVIAQKIVSKAEDRIVNLKDVEASKKAEELAKSTKKDPEFVELVLRETERILKVSKDTLMVEDKRGLVCINAGIDKSNVKGRTNFALLPENPDHSAEKIKADIRKLTGKNVAVIVTDTYSRPFRRGQANFAIGIAGINPFRDYRKKKDLFGLTLKVKNIAIVDEIAAAAELLMGQGTEKTPVIILKGLKNIVSFCNKCAASDLFISNDEDLFKNVL